MFRYYHPNDVLSPKYPKDFVVELVQTIHNANFGKPFRPNNFLFSDKPQHQNEPNETEYYIFHNILAQTFHHHLHLLHATENYNAPLENLQQFDEINLTESCYQLLH